MEDSEHFTTKQVKDYVGLYNRGGRIFGIITYVPGKDRRWYFQSEGNLVICKECLEQIVTLMNELKEPDYTDINNIKIK